MARTKPNTIDSLVRQISGRVNTAHEDRRRKLAELRVLKEREQNLTNGLIARRQAVFEVETRTDTEAENDPRWAHLKSA